MNVASSFRLLREHWCRAPGRRTRGLEAAPNFRPFCVSCRSLSLLFRQVWSGVSRGAEPKSRRCRYPGATDGRHGRHRAKGCPQIGSLQRYTTSAGPCSPPRARRRRLPAENIVSARVLLRCHCAATSDSLRCDARSTRRGRAREHRHRTHTTCAPHAQFGCAAATPRVADQRRRCGCCKQALGVVAPAPALAFA